MNWREKFARLERFGTDWRRLLARGTALLLIGTLLAVASLFNPEAMILGARDFSWLPVAGAAVLTVGVLECFDGFIAKEARDFFLNLPIGVLDLVVGGLIVLSMGYHPERLSLLIAAFLITKGILRLVFSLAVQLPNRRSNMWGACASMLLGILIWLEWPSSAAGYLAFGLSTDIALRGWTLMVFAFWAKDKR